MKLTRLNLRKGDGHKHPDIKTGDRHVYLVKWNDELSLGSFNRERYGLYYTPTCGGLGFQYDKPGTNASLWQGVWLIRERA